MLIEGSRSQSTPFEADPEGLGPRVKPRAASGGHASCRSGYRGHSRPTSTWLRRLSARAGGRNQGAKASGDMAKSGAKASGDMAKAGADAAKAAAEAAKK